MHGHVAEFCPKTEAKSSLGELELGELRFRNHSRPQARALPSLPPVAQVLSDKRFGSEWRKAVALRALYELTGQYLKEKVRPFSDCGLPPEKL